MHTLGTVDLALGFPAGLVINPSSGAISGTLAAGDAASGPYTVTVGAGDGTHSGQTTFTWNVNSVVSLTTPADQTNNAGASVSLPVTAGDAHSSTLTYAATGLPSGLSINSSTGVISGTSSAGRSFQPSVTVSDGTYSNTTTFAWTVSSPIFLTDPGAQTNAVSDSVSLQVSATDSTGGTLSYSASGLPSGLSINSSTGLISGTVGSGAPASSPYTTTVTVGDGSHSAVATFPWDVNAAGPIVLTSPGNQTNVAGDLVAFQVSATDSNGGTLEYSASGLPSGLSINPMTGFLLGTIASGAASGSPYSVTIKAADPSNQASQTFSWTVNTAGVVTMTNPGDQASSEGASVSLSISASASGGGSLAYVAFGLPAGLKINTTSGAITGTVAVGDAAYGPYTVTVVAGNSGYSAAQTFQWTVTDPIAVTAPADQTNNEGDSASLTISASDSTSGATLDYAAIGLPPGLAINASSGAISGTISGGASAGGPYSVTVVAEDGTSSASASFNWTINDPVSFTASGSGGTVTTTVPGTQTNTEGDTVSLTLSASNSGSGTLIYSAFDLPPGLSINPTTGAITGTVAIGDAPLSAYEPTITASNGASSDSADFEWDINGSVSITDPGNQSNTVGDSVSLQILTTYDGSGTLSYAASGLPAGLSISTSTGLITGTVGSGATAIGTYTTTVTAGDGNSTASDTFSWTITAAGTVMLTTPGDQSNSEGDSVSLSLSASGGGTLKYFAQGLPPGLKINPSSGAITGTVALGDTATGQYVVLVSATDGTHGAGEAFNWTVTDPVTITSVPGQTGMEGGSVSVSVSASDTSGGTLKYGAIGLPPGLVINPSTGAITGTMALGAAAAGTYTVTVIAGDSTYSASQTFDWGPGSPVTITSPGNQTNTEGDSVSLTISASDSGGTVRYSAYGLPAGLKINTSSGAITGTVAPGASVQSPYTVVVTASDGTYGAGVTFHWTINDPITITDPGVQDVSEGESVSLAIHASDSHSGTLSFKAINLPLGLVINSVTGVISGTISNTLTAVGTFLSTITVTDGISNAIMTIDWNSIASSFGLGSSVQLTGAEAPAVKVIATRMRVDGDLATLDKDADAGTPYSDLAKAAVAASKTALILNKMEYPALTKLGPFFYFNEAYDDTVLNKKVPAKALVGFKDAMFFEWDIDCTADQAKTIGIVGKEVLTVTKKGAKPQDTTQSLTITPNAKDSPALVFKLKKPVGGATYRVIYWDAPGARILPYAKGSPQGDPAAVTMELTKDSYYSLEAPVTTNVPDSKIPFTAKIEWDPNKVTFTIGSNKAVTIDVK